MNNTVSKIALLGEPVTEHIQNSYVFYTTTTETLNKIIFKSINCLLIKTSILFKMNPINM